MAYFTVTFNALAFVTGSIRVRADSPKDAEDEAFKQLGDVLWQYQGLSEDPVEITDVEETP